jgi:hypothetical protein
MILEYRRRYTCHSSDRIWYNAVKGPHRAVPIGPAQLVYEISRMVLGEADGHVIVIKVAMDESEVDENTPVITVAAYVARPKLWRDWTERWNVAKRPIKVFHAADCANSHGEFEGWMAERRDPFVTRLLDVMEASDIPGVVIGLHKIEFLEAIQGREDLRAIFGTPYTACFHWVTQTIINIANELGSLDRIGFVHECNDYQHEALDSFGWIKRNGNPAARAIGIQFLGKEDYVPLQAADMLAYESNKRIRDPSRPERRPWQRLNPGGRIIAMHYGRENMPELIERLEKIRDGRFNNTNADQQKRGAAPPCDRVPSCHR